MEKLKVGDKVYRKETSRWDDNVKYNLSEVVRLTPTTAVLSNKVKLINEPFKYTEKDAIGYRIFGDKWNVYYLQTKEVVIEAEKEKIKRTVNNWFEKTKFTHEEKLRMYMLINGS